MADIHKLSEQMIDFAERVADVGDATGGTRVRHGSKALSHQVINFAVRLRDVTDAAAGRTTFGRNGFFADGDGGSGARGVVGTTRWVLLPAAGAGLYALARSEFFARQAKSVVDEAKTRASDLPTDLMNGVRQTMQKSTSQSGGQRKPTNQSGGQRRRRTSSTRKTPNR
jgi:hypothetical protein